MFGEITVDTTADSRIIFNVFSDKWMNNYCIVDNDIYDNLNDYVFLILEESLKSAEWLWTMLTPVF
jgi:hypothetical protein